MSPERFTPNLNSGESSQEEQEHEGEKEINFLERFDPEELKETLDAGKIEALELSLGELTAIEENIAEIRADDTATEEQKKSAISTLRQLGESIKKITSRHMHRMKHFGLISLVLFSSFGKMKSTEPYELLGPKEALPAWNHEDFVTQVVLGRMAADGLPQIPTKGELLREELANELINKPEVKTDAQIEDIINDISNRSYDGLIDLALEKGYIDTRSESEIDNFITQTFTFRSHKDFAEREYREYRAIWEMHREHGNPKIRIDTTTDRAYYLAETNTMYITSNAPYKNKVISTKEYRKIIGEWLAELAHSKQYTENSESAFKQRGEDIKTAKAYAAEHGVSFSAARDSTLYHTPGTNEYEAHQEIEPELEDELERRVYGKDTRLAQGSEPEHQSDS